MDVLSRQVLVPRAVRYKAAGSAAARDVYKITKAESVAFMIERWIKWVGEQRRW